MAGKVYANGREVSSKSAGGKAVAAFPDVCLTPPTTPATPPGVPVPYPNTGMASPVKRSEGHLNPRQRAALKAAKKGTAGMGSLT